MQHEKKLKITNLYIKVESLPWLKSGNSRMYEYTGENFSCWKHFPYVSLQTDLFLTQWIRVDSIETKFSTLTEFIEYFIASQITTT